MRWREGAIYLVLEKGRFPSDLRVASTRTKKPKLSSKQLAVKVKIRLPATAFDDLLPVATIEIPQEACIPPEFEIEAQLSEDTPSIS
jgi:hypothetical protein